MIAVFTEVDLLDSRGSRGVRTWVAVFYGSGSSRFARFSWWVLRRHMLDSRLSSVVMFCICRLRDGAPGREHDEIVPNIIDSDFIDGRLWQLVEFHAGSRRLTNRALKWIREELKLEFDVISTVKNKGVGGGMRRDLIPVAYLMGRNKRIIKV